uniref:Uncharacterized protein n=1 Tax=Ficedula albicollis TaxID=59894 RepID=A0A803VID1_FICAL
MGKLWRVKILLEGIPTPKRQAGVKLKTVHTGLLGRVLLVLLINNLTSSKETKCNKCYHPLYGGDTKESLIRIHTNVNPSCFNHSQISTGKTYWIAKNTATFRQRLLGECPRGEAWFCFEHKSNQEGLMDLIKEKQLKPRTQSTIRPKKFLTST